MPINAETKCSLLPSVLEAEATLVAGLKKRDPQSIKTIYKNYGENLLQAVHPEVRANVPECDVLQEIMIKIWYSADQYDAARGRLYTWMVRMARNYSIDILRSKTFKDQQRTISMYWPGIILDNNKVIHNNIDAMAIQHMVEALRPEWSVLLKMFFYEGYTHVQVAQLLKIPLGTIKTRIRMALSKLKKQYVRTLEQERFNGVRPIAPDHE